MNNKEHTNHEDWKLHELLTFKTICATKSHTMMVLAQDQELRDLLEQDIKISTNHIIDLKNLLQTKQDISI